MGGWSILFSMVLISGFNLRHRNARQFVWYIVVVVENKNKGKKNLDSNCFGDSVPILVLYSCLSVTDKNSFNFYHFSICIIL